MTNQFHDKPHFPFTYGDEVKDGGKRLSDFDEKSKNFNRS